MNVVFVTGNPNKAKYFSELVGLTIEHHHADTDEIQSLDLVEIAVHKAKQAYEQLKKPVIVEDSGLVINCMGKLPGPFIKWFISEMGLEHISRLSDPDPKREALATDAFVYFDGVKATSFIGTLRGHIAEHPIGEGGYDWDKIFMPKDEKLTMAQLSHEDYLRFHAKIKPIKKVREFLLTIDKNKA